MAAVAIVRMWYGRIEVQERTLPGLGDPRGRSPHSACLARQERTLVIIIITLTDSEGGKGCMS